MNNKFDHTMSDKEKLEEFQYRPFIKNVYVLLPGYNYLHTTSNNIGKTNVGRERTEEQFLNYLKKGGEKGSYLITGYRGMGKTTLVNRVVSEYSKDKCKYKKVEKVSISFGQKNITELDILKQLVSEIKTKFEKKIHKNYFIGLYKRLSVEIPIILTVIIFCFLFYFLSVKTTYASDADNSIKLETVFSFLLLAILSSIGLTSTVKLIIEKIYSSKLNIYKKITELYDRSTSQYTSEESAGTGSEGFPIILSRKKSKAYALAGAKEISNEIISILNEIEDIEFIFIFDELDKIDTHIQQTLNYEDTNIVSFKGETFAFDDHRKRKKLILEILSSLKYLITEARARFIFIAGSEMFDAAMADVSDRHSAISSIFGHVINVDSLYKDKAKGSLGVGITNLVEQFLQNIIVESGDNKENGYTDSILKTKWYWKEELSFENSLKLMYTIQHFINYLVYRSTGSPKKLIKIIEEHTRVFEMTEVDKLSVGRKSIFAKAYSKFEKQSKSDKKLIFLSFNYYDQYKFGLLNYFYRPIIISKSRIIKNYSDSLLVSIPYLLDHIHKFNGNAFSMENLELLPEVLTAGRNPELRTFLEDLIEHFKQTLIRRTETRFFDYKFNYKIYSEIVHVSTLFAEESSAYNFTLDENYNIKLYLRLKIKELRQIYKDFEGKESDNALDSIAFYNTLLGDLTYFDREYSDAIGCYLDALLAMQNNDQKNEKSLSINDFHSISYLKCLMKLGLCFEKIKSYEKAIACYIDVINVSGKIQTVESKYFLHEELARYKINALFSCLFIYEKQPSLGDFKRLFEIVMSLDKNQKVRELKLIQKRYWEAAKLVGINTNAWAEPLDTEGLISIRFREFLMKDPAFLHHLGILLFYRNTLVVDKKVMKDIFIEMKLPLKLEYKPKEEELNEMLPIICINEVLKKRFKKENLKGVLTQLWEDYKSKRLQPEDSFFAARCLSRLGNLYYASLMPKKKNSSGEILEVPIRETENLFYFLKSSNTIKNPSDMIKDWLDIYTMPTFDHNCCVCVQNLTLEDVFYFYLLSAKLYMASGRSLMGSYQYRKILAILRFYANGFRTVFENNNNKKILYKFIDFIKKTIIKRALQVASWNSSSTDRSQVYKYKHALNINHIFHDESVAKHNYKNISNAPDVKEALWHLIAFDQVCISDSSLMPKNVIEISPNQSFISPYGGIHTMYARLNELDVQCVINKTLLINILPKDFNIKEIYQYLRGVENYKTDPLSQVDHNPFNKINLESNRDNLLQLPYLIANWMFCLQSMIQILQTKGITYLFTFSTIADQYRRLGDLLKYYEFCRYIFEKGIVNVDVFHLAKDMIGKDTLNSMDTTSLYQIATRNYRDALSAHSRGESYKSMISNMYFLEDDFHENIFHFSISFERHRIISGDIMDKVRMLSNELSNSQFFDYNAHINNLDNWTTLFDDTNFDL